MDDKGQADGDEEEEEERSFDGSCSSDGTPPSTIITDVSSSSDEGDTSVIEVQEDEPEIKEDCLVHEMLTLTKLQQLKEHFFPPSTDAVPINGVKLDMQSFIEALRRVLHDVDQDVDDSSFVTLFMRIDVNTRGYIDWDELTAFLLKLDEANRQMAAMEAMTDLVHDDGFERKMQARTRGGQHHRDMIVKIIDVERPGLSAYVSASRDGTIRYWHKQSLQQLRVTNHVESVLKMSQERLAQDSSKSERGAASTAKPFAASPAWITDVAQLPLGNRIVVTCMDRSVSFYEMLTGELVSRITGLGYAPLCVHSYAPANDEQVVFFGDEGGHMHWIKLGPHFHIPSALDRRQPYDVHGKGDVPVHTDAITQVRYIADLRRVISSGLDGTVRMTDWIKGKVLSCFSGHRLAVHAFSYCAEHRVIASVGMGREVIVWNPYTHDVLARCVGHNATVMHCTYDMAHGRIITCSSDKVIKCWDAASYKCLQSLVDHHSYRPDDAITAVLWDAQKSMLILGGNRLVAWRNLGTIQRSETSHSAPVCRALYASNFEQVISADAHSIVSIWSIETGQIVFRFEGAHGSSKITALSLDGAGRRLVTGAHDGTVHMWNFSNGQRLQSFLRLPPTAPLPNTKANMNNITLSPLKQHRTEISGIVFVHQEDSAREDLLGSVSIATTSWDRRIRVYEDKPGAGFVYPDKILVEQSLPPNIEHDLICLTWCGGQQVANGTFGGDVVVWSIDGGQVRMRLQPNLHEVRMDDDVSSLGGFTSKGMDLQQGGIRPGLLMFGEEEEEEEEVDQDAFGHSPQNQPVFASLPAGGPISLGNSGNILSPVAAEDEDGSVSSGGDSVAASAPQSPPRTPKEPFDAERNVDKSNLVSAQGTSPSSQTRSPFPPSVVSKSSQAHSQRRRLHLVEASSPKPEQDQTEGGDLGESFTEMQARDCGSSAVDALLYLKGVNIIISGGASGNLHFWDCIDGACLLAIPACHPDDTGITALGSGGRQGENMLFSGCVMGTVKTWKLGNLEALTYSAKIRQRANVLHDAFQVICGAEQAQNGDENDSMSRDEDDVGGAYGSSKARAHAAPTGKLCSGQRSWRAHLAAVVSIEWVDYAEHQLLITSGSDCNVNLWTIDGMHIGTFGQAHPWNIARSTTWLCTAAASPIDGGNMGTAAPNGTERNEHQGDSESECSSGEDDSAVFRSCQSLDRLEREQEQERQRSELKAFQEKQTYRLCRMRLERKLLRSRISAFCSSPPTDELSGTRNPPTSQAITVIEDYRKVASRKKMSAGESRGQPRSSWVVCDNQVWQKKFVAVLADMEGARKSTAGGARKKRSTQTMRQSDASKNLREEIAGGDQSAAAVAKGGVLVVERLKARLEGDWQNGSTAKEEL